MPTCRTPGMSVIFLALPTRMLPKGCLLTWSVDRVLCSPRSSLKPHDDCKPTQYNFSRWPRNKSSHDTPIDEDTVGSSPFVLHG